MSFFLIMADRIGFEEFSEVFGVLKEFLRNTSSEDFEVQEIKEKGKIPLGLPDKTKSKLKEALSDHPEVYRAGIEKDPNFLYLLGQFLTVLATKLDYMQVLKNDPEIKKTARLFYHIWESHNHMNAASLFKKMKSKSNSEAKSELIPLLSRSEKISEKFEEKPEKVQAQEYIFA